MADLNDSPEPRKAPTVESLDLQLKSISSVTLARLVEEVRIDDDGERFSPTAYNRTYHRHNR